jgi:hypothetical protein
LQLTMLGYFYQSTHIIKAIEAAYPDAAGAKAH